MSAAERTASGFSDIGSRVRRAYTLALCLVGLLAIGAFLVLDGFIAQQGEAASIINVAGKQRMLSQRIAGLAQTLSRSSEIGPVRRDEALLRAAIDDMTTAHESLMKGDDERNLPGIRSEAEGAYYAERPHAVDARVRAFLADANALLVETRDAGRVGIAARMSDAARRDLLGALNAVVLFHENRARTDAARAESIHLALLFATIVILFSEARFIFAPLAGELLGKDKAVREKQAELTYKSLHDQLTGLFNRHYLHAVAQSFPAEASDPVGSSDAKAGRFSLIAIDIDNFKDVNDANGHEAGDRMLRIVADRIRENVRENDLAFRIGGDEFLLSIDSDEPGLAHGIAERLRADLQAALSVEPGCSSVAASIGIARFPEHGASFDEVHANADIALYHAKSTGKNAISVFHDDLRIAFEQRRASETFVREALDADAFEPFFQPQVDMRSGRVVGVEALARCRGADGAIVSPGAFLPVAEATGLIVPLGEQVIDKAVRIAGTWLVEGRSFGRLSINASSAQLHHRGFVDFLASTLERHGVPGSRLSVEILETVLVDGDDDTVVEIVRAIRALGISVELDDFGAGHTSIANVNRLEIDRIKIDRSFIDGIEADVSKVHVLEAILTMARSLGIHVMAEGIETDLQQRQLLAHGCSTGQGFLLARPMSERDMHVWLDEAVGSTSDVRRTG